MPFSFEDTPIQGLVLIKKKIFKDARGIFFESYKKSDFQQFGIDREFVQDNCSLSHKGVLRGLHYQISPYEQGKLIQVVSGSIWDVAVDIRPNSPTYLKWHGVELSSDNGRMFYIPEGFAHGFITLSDRAYISYKCTAEYAKEYERGILWNDPLIAITWPMSEPLLSEKDKIFPYLKENI